MTDIRTCSLAIPSWLRIDTCVNRRTRDRIQMSPHFQSPQLIISATSIKFQAIVSPAATAFLQAEKYNFRPDRNMGARSWKLDWSYGFSGYCSLCFRPRLLFSWCVCGHQSAVDRKPWSCRCWVDQIRRQDVCSHSAHQFCLISHIFSLSVTFLLFTIFYFANHKCFTRAGWIFMDFIAWYLGLSDLQTWQLLPIRRVSLSSSIHVRRLQLASGIESGPRPCWGWNHQSVSYSLQLDCQSRNCRCMFYIATQTSLVAAVQSWPLFMVIIHVSVPSDMILFAILISLKDHKKPHSYTIF